MSQRPSFSVEYVDPVLIDAEPLPDEFSPSRLRRSAAVVVGVALAIAAAIVLLPGLDSLRDRFQGAQPGWLVVAAGLELASCASYVLVFRRGLCGPLSWRARH